MAHCVSMKHTSVPKEKCPLVFVPVGTPGGTPPPVRSKTPPGPHPACYGTNTEVTSAKGHFRAYPTIYIYIYIERERDTHIHTHIYTLI